ncbi:18929_t:CDS:2 [Funneliformis geosporum]|uniref:Endoplasmic reticulum junction formation protein lunapark n=1 Tax=Funneliformis geosporum TaxID=1117311 RepID=A0A9W4SG68_9GLOM|nr:9031_t:CDS:2 [Funneliformis geosporum]CAI2179800.1 18929_t:CDS:2 [Funneliformis geosporum]
MGVVFSRFRSQNEDNFEKILSEIDDKISRAEVRLREIRIRERSALIIWIVYSMLAYVAYVAGYWYFVYMSIEEEGWDFMKIAPVFTGPFLIVIGYRFLALWYKRKETNEISQLEHLRAKQRQKVEELKNKHNYYSTKDLVERYDFPKGPKGPPQVNQQNQPIQNGTARPRQPINPNNPNLRQRNVPNLQAPGVNSINGDQRNNNASNVGSGGAHGGNASPQTKYDPNSPNSISPIQKRWFDKLVDVIVGDDEQKYALICQNCFTWNGLAYPADFEDVQYYCKKCNHFNSSRRSQLSGTSLSVSPSLTNGNNSNDSNENHLNITNSHFNKSNGPSQLGDPLTPRRGRSTTPRPMIRLWLLDPTVGREGTVEVKIGLEIIAMEIMKMLNHTPSVMMKAFLVKNKLLFSN